MSLQFQVILFILVGKDLRQGEGIDCIFFIKMQVYFNLFIYFSKFLIFEVFIIFKKNVINLKLII